MYTIRRTSDLKLYQRSLECIYEAGLTPTSIPSGALEENILTILNNELTTLLTPFLEMGKNIAQVNCGHVDDNLR